MLIVRVFNVFFFNLKTNLFNIYKYLFQSCIASGKICVDFFFYCTFLFI